MDARIYPRFSAGILYAEEDEATLNEIQKCVRNLRKQGFQIHDFGLLGSRMNCIDRTEDADLFLIICTPDMKAYGDLMFITEIPGVLEKMQTKPCIPVLLQGTAENAVPDWANAPVIDCRPGNQETGYDLHHMDIPLGMKLRHYEFEKLACNIPEEDRSRIYMDCISVFRSKKLDRFIFHNRTDEEYVRILCALGKKTPPLIPAFTDYIVFKDPYNFQPDSNKDVAVKIARVENRDLNPESATFGAYHLSKATSFRIPEKLLYEDHPELVQIAASVLQQLTGSDDNYAEADPEELHMMDMEYWPPLPSEEESDRDNTLRADMHAMELAVNLMINGIPDFMLRNDEKGEDDP